MGTVILRSFSPLCSAGLRAACACSARRAFLSFTRGSASPLWFLARPLLHGFSSVLASPRFVLHVRAWRTVAPNHALQRTALGRPAFFLAPPGAVAELESVRRFGVTFPAKYGTFPVPEGIFPVPGECFPIPDGSFPLPEGTFPGPDECFPAPDSTFPGPGGSFPAPDECFPGPDGCLPAAAEHPFSAVLAGPSA